MHRQYDIYLINLDPTVGREIRKSRPCVIVSPDEMNNSIGTAIIAPMTTKSHDYPTRVPINFQSKDGFVVLDQLRTVDKSRLVKRLGAADRGVTAKIKRTIKEMLVD